MTMHRAQASGRGGGRSQRTTSSSPTGRRDEDDALDEGKRVELQGEFNAEECCAQVVGAVQGVKSETSRLADAAQAIDSDTGRIADGVQGIEQDTDRIAGGVEKLATSAQALVTASGNLKDATKEISTTLRGLPALATIDRSVTLRRAEVENDEMAPLWMAINLHTERISFPAFDDFMSRVLCGGERAVDLRTDENLNDQMRRLARLCHVPGVDIYDLLRTSAETFLLLECGVCEVNAARRGPGELVLGTPGGALEATLQEPDAREKARAAPLDRSVDRFGRERTLTFAEAEQKLSTFLGRTRNNYLQTVILQNAFPQGTVRATSPFCDDDVLLDQPCLLELIWSYWMEEGMLTQTVAAITRRFQNVRRPGRGPDPLSEFELDPLRPLNAFLWGYLQDEPNRLSVARRAYEYSHHYGLNLYGRAVPALRPADPRSRFLEAFHNLLRQAAAFYREDNDTTVIADAFPVLNSLKEVHLILSEGAHNQFRDLPWTARVEMLIQQWLLARPEMREFLRGRYMVAYPERWMGAVDSMKKLQGWTDTSVLHFRDLARFGERILLSIRYGNWSATNDQRHAQAWLRYWKEEIQGYIHAYHTATGVNLSDDVVEVRERADIRYLQPSWHLRNRLLAARRAARAAQ